MTGDRVYRRKACDLCARKKIKCNYDMLVCANCSSYGVECSTSTAVRGRQPSNAKRDDRGKNSNRPLAQESAEQPLAAQQTDIQAKLDQILDSLRSTAATTSHTGGSTAMAHNQPLPPLEVILPAIEHYFKTLNSKMPFFYEPTFMRMLTNHYSQPPRQHDDAFLSAIFVVVALGYSMSKTDSAIDRAHAAGSGQRETLACFISEIERMFFKVIDENPGLIVAQVSGAMACYYNCVGHLRKANVFIGMAIRLAFQLQLHSRQFFALPSTCEEQEEGIQIFWSIFVLEKEISFRLKMPSMLLGAEIDTPLPSFASVNGSITSANKEHSFNILHARIKLGQLEDQVYHLLYSARSQGVESTSVQHDAAALGERLEQWFSEIPPAFHLDSESLNNLEGVDISSIFKVHLEYLSKLISLYGILSPNTQWLSSLSSLGKTAIQESVVAMVGRANADYAQRLGPPSAKAWHRCVSLGLQYVNHFRWAFDLDPSILKYGDVLCSAIIIVLADQLRPSPDICIKEADYAEIMEVVERLKGLPSTGTVFETHTQHLWLVVDELCSKLGEKLAAGSLQFNPSIQVTPSFSGDNDLLLGLQEWSDIDSEAIFLDENLMRNT